MARFAGDGTDKKFSDGTEAFNTAKTASKNNGSVSVNTSFENGQLNISIQNIVNPIPTLNPQAQESDIEPLAPKSPYVNKPQVNEQQKASTFKPVMTEISSRKSDTSAQVQGNIVEHFNQTRNITTHEIEVGEKFKFSEKAGQFVDESKTKQFIDEKTYDEIKNNTVITGNNANSENQRESLSSNRFNGNPNTRDYNRFENKEVKTRFTQSTNQAGGASFKTTYKDGQIKNTKVVLATGKNRTDRKGFKNKTYDFIDKVDSVKELVRDEEGDAEDKTISKEIVVVEHSIKRHKKKKSRYKELDKGLKRDVKTLKKEVEAEQKAAKSAEIEGKFNKSAGGDFLDNHLQFSDNINEKFKIKAKKDQERFIAVKSDENKSASFIEPAAKNPMDRFTDEKRKEGAKKSVSDLFNKKDEKNGEQKIDFANMTNKEKLELRQSQRKAARKAKRAETKKIAQRTAVVKMLQTRKAVHDELNSEATGDLIRDGQGPIISLLVDTVKNFVANIGRKIGRGIANLIGKLFKLLIRAVLSFIGFLFTNLAPIVVAAAPAVCIAVAFIFFFNTDSGAGSFDVGDISGDGLLYSSLDDSDIESILSSVLGSNPDITDEQLSTLAYALSKVGCEYDQAYHGNTSVDIFDCSSLVYRAYQEAGVDISNSGIYTAAEECRALMSSGNTVTGDLQPGDLIFYGGSDNGRYLGIYHVAIYVGNVDGVDKMVEARDTDSGVVYCDLRGSNVVNVSRPMA